MTVQREMTGEERAKVKKLIVQECANYDKKEGCLPLECDCVMFSKIYTGGGCKYFRKIILPLDPMLETTFTEISIETRHCAICGSPFPVKNSRKAYCSEDCAGKAQRKRNREHMRKKRRACG